MLTKEKAIEIINNRFSIMDYQESESLGEALDVAVEVLRTQIPKKPVPFHYRYIHNDKEEEQIQFRCPTCDKNNNVGFWDSFVSVGQRRCNRCDTLLDWS